MGRELQKKKNKSGVARVRQKPKSKKSLLLSNPIIAANWDKKQTLAQNYRRLGLATRLNGHTGGVDKRASTSAAPFDAQAAPGVEALNIKKSQRVTQITPREVRIERDPETGAILRVLDDEAGEGVDENDTPVQLKRFKPLQDPLNTIDLPHASLNPHHPSGHVGGASDSSSSSAFLQRLEQDAARPGGKKIRKQSVREGEWCGKLVERHGEDWAAMVKDTELNIMQQSEGDIKRRVGKWLKERKV